MLASIELPREYVLPSLRPSSLRPSTPASVDAVSISMKDAVALHRVNGAPVDDVPVNNAPVDDTPSNDTPINGAYATSLSTATIVSVSDGKSCILTSELIV